MQNVYNLDCVLDEVDLAEDKGSVGKAEGEARVASWLGIMTVGQTFLLNLGLWNLFRD